jgi:hypothetical protein
MAMFSVRALSLEGNKYCGRVRCRPVGPASSGSLLNYARACPRSASSEAYGLNAGAGPVGGVAWIVLVPAGVKAAVRGYMAISAVCTERSLSGND